MSSDNPFLVFTLVYCLLSITGDVDGVRKEIKEQNKQLTKVVCLLEQQANQSGKR